MLLSDVCLSVCLSDVCLSVAYIGPKSRTDRPRKTRIVTEVAHFIYDPDTSFMITRSKVMVTSPLCSPPCWRVRRLQQWAWERVGRGKLLLRCRLLGGGRRFGTLGGGEGRGHTVAAARLQHSQAVQKLTIVQLPAASSSSSSSSSLSSSLSFINVKNLSV